MKNMNTADRVIRTLIVVAIAAAYFTGNLSSPWALGLGVVAAVLLGTSFLDLPGIHAVRHLHPPAPVVTRMAARKAVGGRR